MLQAKVRMVDRKERVERYRDLRYGLYQFNCRELTNDAPNEDFCSQ